MTLSSAPLPLEGLLVIDLSQFLSGPFAALKLADLGARVIKVERPEGDLGRRIYLSDLDIAGTNSLFHAINRNKEGFSANLKNPSELAKVKALIAKADVVIQNFRPGVIRQYGLDFASVSAINPTAIYASISGYGEEGEWIGLPGQDLLAQARSGLMWLNGDANDPPAPMGLAIADQLAAHNTVQGILAGLIQRGKTGVGTHVQTSLLEALLDFQFEVLTTHLNDPGLRLPARSAVNNAHAYLAAPYGVYATADGHLAIAMTPIPRLAQVISCEAIAGYIDPNLWFTQRDEIKSRLASHIRTKSTAEWLSLLVPADIWVAEVLDWTRLAASPGFQSLEFLQTLRLANGETIKTTRLPIRFADKTLNSERPAPAPGEHNQSIGRDFALDEV